METYQCKNCGHWRASQVGLAATIRCRYCGVRGQWRFPRYQCENCQHRRDSTRWKSRAKIKCTECGTVGRWQIVTAALDASKTDLSMYLFHTDLCIQAYQFYAQSLVWPLDPWYDRLARKHASRRDNMMSELYAVFANARAGDINDKILVDTRLRGPGSAYDPDNPVDVKLDPILTRYHQIEPARPAFQYEADGNWTVFRFKGPITDDVREVYFCEYTNKDAERPFLGATEISKLDFNGTGSDVIYGFEGATGKTRDRKYPNWSMMGYVLSRERNGTHDVHVVFRGSRSALLSRAAPKAEFLTAGNADWITDLSAKKDTMPLVSTEGKICRGFGLSITSALGTISAILDKIDTDRGKPDRIFITGHSLGAALATAFTSAVRCGEFGASELSPSVKQWPWEDLVLLPISSPAIGSRTFRDWFNKRVSNVHRFYVGGDAVPMFGQMDTRSLLKPETWLARFTAWETYHVGSQIEFKKRDDPSKKPDDPNQNSDDMNAHEPMSVRWSLEFRYELAAGPSEWDYGPMSPDFYPPMIKVKGGGLQNMLSTADAAKLGLLPQDLFPPHTKEDVVFFIRVLQRVLSKSSSYVGAITPGEAQKRRDILDKFFHTEDWDQCKAAIDGGLFEEFKQAQGDLGPYLSLLYTSLIVKEHGRGTKNRFDEIQHINPAAEEAYTHSGAH